MVVLKWKILRRNPDYFTFYKNMIIFYSENGNSHQRFSFSEHHINSLHKLSLLPSTDYLEPVFWLLGLMPYAYRQPVPNASMPSSLILPPDVHMGIKKNLPCFLFCSMFQLRLSIYILQTDTGILFFIPVFPRIFPGWQVSGHRISSPCFEGGHRPHQRSETAGCTPEDTIEYTWLFSIIKCVIISCKGSLHLPRILIDFWMCKGEHSCCVLFPEDKAVNREQAFHRRTLPGLPEDDP